MAAAAASSAIPEAGVAILHGATGATMFCAWPGDDALDEVPDQYQGVPIDDGLRRTIAGQCCTAGGACRRMARPHDGGESSDSDECIAGQSSRDYPHVRRMNYSAVSDTCASMGILNVQLRSSVHSSASRSSEK